jgi:hypothetical protein
MPKETSTRDRRCTLSTEVVPLAAYRYLNDLISFLIEGREWLLLTDRPNRQADRISRLREGD